MGTVTVEQLVEVSGLGLAGMEAAVGRMHQDLDKFLQTVVVQGKVRQFKAGGLGSWRTRLFILKGGFGQIWYPFAILAV